MKDFLKIYIPILIVAGLLLFWAVKLMRPAPPDTLTLATGIPGGAYHALGEQYRKALEARGLTIELVETSGSVDNLNLLMDETSGVELAFIQGGVGSGETSPDLMAIASIFPEPLILFVPSESNALVLGDLVGSTIAVGPPGSGTRLLAEQVFGLNRLLGEVIFSDLSGTGAIEALRSGGVDAVFSVSSRSFDELSEILETGDLRIFPYDRAEAYRKRLPFLKSISLPRGVLDLRSDIPTEDIPLIAPVAQLVARNDLHPALVELILDEAMQIHRPESPFALAGEFPSRDFLDYPLSEDALRYFRDGPTVLRRIFPFWLASLIGRLLVVLIPLIGLLIPLFRFAPVLLTWRIRRRIFKWYRNVRDIEIRARMNVGNEKQTNLCIKDLDEIEDKVTTVSVPLSYSDELYRLRVHIGFVRDLILNKFHSESEKSG